MKKKFIFSSMLIILTIITIYYFTRLHFSNQKNIMESITLGNAHTVEVVPMIKLTPIEKEIIKEQTDITLTAQIKCTNIMNTYQNEQAYDIKVDCILDGCNCSCEWIDIYHDYNYVTQTKTLEVCL